MHDRWENFNKEATKFRHFPKSVALLHFSSPHLGPLVCPSVPSVNEKWVGTCPPVWARAHPCPMAPAPLVTGCAADPPPAA